MALRDGFSLRCNGLKPPFRHIVRATLVSLGIAETSLPVRKDWLATRSQYANNHVSPASGRRYAK